MKALSAVAAGLAVCACGAGTGQNAPAAVATAPAPAPRAQAASSAKVRFVRAPIVAKVVSAAGATPTYDVWIRVSRPLRGDLAASLTLDGRAGGGSMTRYKRTDCYVRTFDNDLAYSPAMRAGRLGSQLTVTVHFKRKRPALSMRTPMTEALPPKYDADKGWYVTGPQYAKALGCKNG